MFKKLLLMVILLLMTFNVCYAEDNIDSNTIVTELDNVVGGVVFKEIDVEEEFSVQTFSSSSFLSAEEYLRQQLYNHTETIDLRNYGLTLSELANILSVNKDFMVASGYIRYDYIREIQSQVKDRIVTYYVPDYLFETIQEDELGRDLINKSIEEYVQEIKSKTNDPLGRLLLLHDKLIEDCEYGDINNIKSYSLYSVFAYKEPVCQGYSQAMYFIGRELGLDVELCLSFEIGHIWNYVKIDDKYYHIDATWDDPVIVIQYVKVDENGEWLLDENGNPIIEREERFHRTTAVHKNFLMSDETMQSEGADHGSKSNWATSAEAIPVCDSKKYESNHFFNILNPFTTNVNNGNYEITLYIQTYTGTNENKVFYSEDLYTGPIITSYPEENNDFYFIYCFMTENTKSFNVFVKAQESERITGVVRYSRNLATYYPKQSLTGQQIFKSHLPDGDNKLSVYMWDMETMRPLSRVITISNTADDSTTGGSTTGGSTTGGATTSGTTN